MNLPTAPQAYGAGPWQIILTRIGAAFDGCFKKRQDVELANGERLILKSPDGARWSVGVDNSGAFTSSAL